MHWTQRKRSLDHLQGCPLHLADYGRPSGAQQRRLTCWTLPRTDGLRLPGGPESVDPRLHRGLSRRYALRWLRIRRVFVHSEPSRIWIIDWVMQEVKKTPPSLFGRGGSMQL